MEISILHESINEALRSDIKSRMGDDEFSPNWKKMNEITIGIALGSCGWNCVLWQGQQYWVLGDDIFKYFKK